MFVYRTCLSSLQNTEELYAPNISSKSFCKFITAKRKACECKGARATIEKQQIKCRCSSKAYYKFLLLKNKKNHVDIRVVVTTDISACGTLSHQTGLASRRSVRVLCIIHTYIAVLLFCGALWEISFWEWNTYTHRKIDQKLHASPWNKVFVTCEITMPQNFHQLVFNIISHCGASRGSCSKCIQAWFSYVLAEEYNSIKSWLTCLIKITLVG